MSPVKSTTQSTDVITVTLGQEAFSPYEYQSFRVGPFSMTTNVQEGETPDEAFKRAYDFLRRMRAEAFKNERADFYQYARDSKPS